MSSSFNEWSENECFDSESCDERERWNLKYSESRGSRIEPDPFLGRAFSEFIQPLFPAGGSALDLAGGAGRHAIWLARQGWEVTLIDISETGIELARHKAGPLASHIHLVVDDLTHFTAAQTQFDLLMVFFYPERRIFSEIVKAIRPGRPLVYKTYTLAQAGLAGGPKDGAHLLKPGELLRLIEGLRVLHYAEAVTEKEMVAEKTTAQLVARKNSEADTCCSTIISPCNQASFMCK